MPKKKMPPRPKKPVFKATSTVSSNAKKALAAKAAEALKAKGEAKAKAIKARAVAAAKAAAKKKPTFKPISTVKPKKEKEITLGEKIGGRVRPAIEIRRQAERDLLADL